MLYDTKWDTAIQVRSDPFLSAERLGVSQKARDALITVLGMMERGEIKHAKMFAQELVCVVGASMPDRLNGMQMARVWSYAECGTAGCLLGWARWVADDITLITGSERDDNKELLNLFCMGGYSGTKSVFDLTPADVAPALRGWLTNGTVVWPR